MLYQHRDHTLSEKMYMYEHAVLLLICSKFYSQLFTRNLSMVIMHELSMVSGGGGS